MKNILLDTNILKNSQNEFLGHKKSFGFFRVYGLALEKKDVAHALAFLRKFNEVGL